CCATTGALSPIIRTTPQIAWRMSTSPGPFADETRTSSILCLSERNTAVPVRRVLRWSPSRHPGGSTTTDGSSSGRVERSLLHGGAPGHCRGRVLRGCRHRQRRAAIREYQGRFEQKEEPCASHSSSQPSLPRCCSAAARATPTTTLITTGVRG